jgi:hypothetical protein
MQILGMGGCEKCKAENCKGKPRERTPQEMRAAIWTYENCKDRQTIDESDTQYASMLLFISQIRKGGYRFDNDDFPVDIWLDLGAVESCLASMQNIRLF